MHSLDGNYQYPQFELWKKLDPQQKMAEAYNRYGYARFIPHGASDISFSLLSTDSFAVGINLDSDDLRYLGVTHCLVTGLDTRIFDQSSTLKRVFSSKNSHIYQVVSPLRPNQ